jgi:hypothetical protein
MRGAVLTFFLLNLSKGSVLTKVAIAAELAKPSEVKELEHTIQRIDQKLHICRLSSIIVVSRRSKKREK